MRVPQEAQVTQAVHSLSGCREVPGRSGLRNPINPLKKPDTLGLETPDSGCVLMVVEFGFWVRLAS